jgi:uncharacterized phage protein (TIGR01671 family)
MRELKFKFWNKLAHRFQAPNKYAIQGDGLYVSYDYEMMAWDDPSSFEDSILVPCQYTGLKDKKGKEIYEGDIVKGLFFDTDVMADLVTICPVVWVEDRACFNIGHRYWTRSATTVIGNIYENPELLKQ